MTTPFSVVTEHAACPVCGAERWRPYRPGMYAIGDVRFDLARCDACSFVGVEPRPDAATLLRMYADPSYYAEGYTLGVETRGYFERQDELLRAYDADVARLEAETGGPGTLFELGAAGGFLLEAARRRGWTVHGVEPSPEAARFARERLGLDVVDGTLDDTPLAPGTVDLVVADNVLEHTTDPRAVLRRLHTLLRPGGHLVVIVPTYVNSPYFRLLLAVRQVVPARLLGPRMLRILKLDEEHDGGFPYHVLEFDRGTLVRLARSAGYEVVAVEGSLPQPAHLFEPGPTRLTDRLLRVVFRTLDALMRARLAPPARVRLLARATAT
jgi:SAM-dependent methyltransferase